MNRLVAGIFCIFLVIFSPSFTSAGEKNIRILHVNDFHGFAEPYKPLGSQEVLGGVSVLAEKVNNLRNERPTLLLSAGDMIQGNTWTNLFQGESVIELMNHMKFDAMVVGNHEFDFGQEVLKRRILEARFPVLGANVTGIDALKPYVIKELNGVKIAIIGIVTQDTPVSTHPRNVDGLLFASPAVTVDILVSELRDRVDILVVLSHIGHQEDRALAESVKGIDVIVGGHSHTNVEKPVIIGKTIILQAWEHGKALGVLDITVEDGRIKTFEGHLEEIKPDSGKGDPSVRKIVEKYSRKVSSILNEKLGEADVDLDGEQVRKRETNLGNLITDIMRRVSGADVAILNGGDIRTSIRKGEITVSDVYSVLPFNDYIVAIKLTGKQIREALEHGVSAIEEGGGGFPQVSGLRFTFSPSLKEGPRVKEVLIGGVALDPEREYLVATNDFLAAGGDGYTVFGEAIQSSKDFSNMGGTLKGEKIVYSDSSRALKDVLADYIREKKRISPFPEGRIREVQD
jgi:5'-nucleotidase/UDP-sugar diphosphatase